MSGNQAENRKRDENDEQISDYGVHIRIAFVVRTRRRTTRENTGAAQTRRKPYL
jgi:hypothetical protein